MKPPEDDSRPARALDLILTPRRWPVRWRLAAVSAGLTLVILVVFAVVVGNLVEDRLQTSFDNELRDNARTLSLELEVTGEASVSPEPGEVAMATSPAAVRVVNAAGDPISSTGATDLGRPVPSIEEVGDLRVAAAPIQSPSVDQLYVQYARNTDELDATVKRLWLLLACGVIGGTALAALAGVAVAGRAMRPIAALTATAREIASTRDPSRRIPEPERDDEVAELARTLDDMLRELDAARAETQLMMQSQREFIADASHELRTPLTSILANLDLLHDQLSEHERAGEQGEMVASALTSSQRMRRLIADLLLLARADAGRTGTRRECDLGEVVEAALAEVRPVADSHRLEVSGGEPVSLEGDPDELHRLVVNLLDNAVRHTPSGTTIDVAVRRRDGEAVLEVADDGPGIPEGEREQIFSRFARGGGPADLMADSGTGLGLAIVKAVAGSHGGTVEAGESPSGGARFTVILPAADSASKS